MIDVVRITLPSEEWGEVKIMRPVPKADPWGCLAPLKGTTWGNLIPVVRGESLSTALYGYSIPLMREIGPSPYALLKLVDKPFRVCDQSKGCLMFDSAKCQPGPDLPDCYDPPGLEMDARSAAVTVALAWRDGYHVIIVGDGEFSIG